MFNYWLLGSINAYCMGILYNSRGYWEILVLIAWIQYFITG